MNAGEVIEALVTEGDAALEQERHHINETADEQEEAYYRGVRHGVTKAIAIVATAAVTS